MMAVWRLKGEATQGLQKESPTFLVKILFTLVGKNRQTNQRISHTTKRIRKNCAVKFYRCSRIILKNIERTIYLKSTRLKLNSNRKNRNWVWVKIIKKKARNQKGRTKYTAEGRSNCRKSSTAPPKSKSTSQLSTCQNNISLKGGGFPESRKSSSTKRSPSHNRRRQPGRPDWYKQPTRLGASPCPTYP